MRIKALTIVAGRDVNARTRGPQVASILKTDVAGAEDKEWKVRTVELAPGAANAPHFYSGVELVYVLEGAGRLEVEGEPFVTIPSGAVAAVSPKRRHLLKNASQTQPLKVLFVLLREKGQSDPDSHNPGAERELQATEGRGARQFNRPRIGILRTIHATGRE